MEKSETIFFERSLFAGFGGLLYFVEFIYFLFVSGDIFEHWYNKNEREIYITTLQAIRLLRMGY